MKTRHLVRPHWIYCCSDERRRITKVGVSSKPSERVRAASAGASYALRVVGFSDAHRRQTLIAAWPLGALAFNAAEAIEQEIHRALRGQLEVAGPTRGAEWYVAHPRAVVAIVDAFMFQRGVLRQELAA